MMNVLSPPIPSINKESALAKNVLEALLQMGIREFCICPGARNVPLIYPLTNYPNLSLYYWPEERSAAFFALGRIKATTQPVAIVTTSGTAAAELLPAIMEAYYSGLPLIAITADRPKRFRGSGAPQCAEQVGLFGHYVEESQDLEQGEFCKLEDWSLKAPIHLNVCFEEPVDSICQETRLENSLSENKLSKKTYSFEPATDYLHFLNSSCYPLVVVGGLPPSQHESAIRFLRHLQAPVYLEGASGIRETPALKELQITGTQHLWQCSAEHNYPIDAILRIGAIPTTRIWRDLEDKKDELLIHSVSDLPFSGLSEKTIKPTLLPSFFEWALNYPRHQKNMFSSWKIADIKFQERLHQLFNEEPLAESSLIHKISKKIPKKSKIYLGNSLPIREWDLAAIYDNRSYQIGVSRGMNGIDGQLATFLGFSSKEQDNWAILGDLTLLYDMIAPWVFSQLSEMNVNVIVVNNGGGKIFSQMFAHPAIQNQHTLSFKPLAAFWGWQYEKWEEIPDRLTASKGARLIELVPHPKATMRFWQSLKGI